LAKAGRHFARLRAAGAAGRGAEEAPSSRLDPVVAANEEEERM